MVEVFTLVAKYWKLLVLESHPFWFCFADVHHSSSAQGLGDIDLDSHSEVTTLTFSNRGTVDLLNSAQGFSDSFGSGFIHVAEGKIVHLDPKRGFVKSGIIH